MIGNPKWFSRRKYSGWGLTPVTWQGWVYVILFILPIALIPNLPLEKGVVNILLFTVLGIFIVDILVMMIRLKKDERETIHEALSERNAAWTIIAVLTIGLGYQISSSIIYKKFEFDPIIFVALFAGVMAKALTNWYLRNK